MPSEGAGVDVDADVTSNRNHRVCQNVAELSKLVRLIESIKVARMVRIVRASRSVQKRLKCLDLIPKTRFIAKTSPSNKPAGIVPDY